MLQLVVPPAIAMLLNIKEMEVRKLPFAEAWEPDGFDFSDSGVAQKGPLVAEGLAELLPDTGGEVRVHGLIRAELETECDRCLGRASFHIDVPFDLFYRPLKPAAHVEEVAIDEGEAEMGFYELPGLQLEDIVREQVLLQLPMQRVCSDACKGICPVCGANRNETSCSCQPQSGEERQMGDPRWIALKDLHI
jgi:uncharacterized protein